MLAIHCLTTATPTDCKRQQAVTEHPYRGNPAHSRPSPSFEPTRWFPKPVKVHHQGRRAEIRRFSKRHHRCIASSLTLRSSSSRLRRQHQQVPNRRLHRHPMVVSTIFQKTLDDSFHSINIVDRICRCSINTSCHLWQRGSSTM